MSSRPPAAGEATEQDAQAATRQGTSRTEESSGRRSQRPASAPATRPTYAAHRPRPPPTRSRTPPRSTSSARKRPSARRLKRLLPGPEHRDQGKRRPGHHRLKRSTDTPAVELLPRGELAFHPLSASGGFSWLSGVDRLPAFAAARLHEGSIRLGGSARIRASPAAVQFWASVRWRGG